MRKQQRAHQKYRKWQKQQEQQRLEDAILGNQNIWAIPEEIARDLRERKMVDYYRGGFKIHWGWSDDAADRLSTSTA